jgi:mannose-6-phosphate isomerase-like protein (cupin superfamily)
METAEHYSWGSGCDGWHLVNQAELSVIRERMPPGTAEVRHLHRIARQFFFILSGTAQLEAGGITYQLTTGQGLEVVPGTPHQICNLSASDVEFIVVSQPHSHGDRELAPA